MDLSKWEETKGDSTSVPAVLTLLLDHLTSHSSKSPAKTQNSWILEAPLSSIHHLRNSLNSSTSLDQIDLERYDLPIVTGAVKEWFLELNVIPFPLYAEISKVYPRGAAIENKMELLSGILSKLPSVNLQVLNMFIKYLSQLIASVVVEEQQTFLLKLSLTLASCIARPATYNSLTLQDKFPSTLLIDLISNVSILEKLTEESQKKKDERYKPRRQRTRPLDKRRFRTASSLASEPAILPTESPTSTATVELLSPPKPSAVVVPVPVEMETATPPKPLAVVVPVPIETKLVTVTAAAIETLQEESQPLKSSLSRSKRASLRGPRSQRNELIKDEENNELVKEEDSSEEFKECE